MNYQHQFYNKLPKEAQVLAPSYQDLFLDLILSQSPAVYPTTLAITVFGQCHVRYGNVLYTNVAQIEPIMRTFSQESGGSLQMR